MNKLLSALAPQGARLVAGRPEEDSDALGILPLLAVAGKGLGKGLGVGLKKGMAWVRSPEGQKFISKLKDTAKKRDSRLKFFESKAGKAKNPKSKARWLRRAARQQQRIDAIRQEANLAERGVVGEGPVLEYRRNLLALEWEEGSPAKKKEISTTIKKMDARLKRLSRERKLLAETTGEKVGAGSGISPLVRKLASRSGQEIVPTPGLAPVVHHAVAAAMNKKTGLLAHQIAKRHGKIPLFVLPGSGGAWFFFVGRRDADAVQRAAEAQGWPLYGIAPQGEAWAQRVGSAALRNLPANLVPNRALTDGRGGLRFTVESPPGPGRLVRIPFYPVQAINSWSGVGGIDFPDDDPVINVRLTGGNSQTAPILLQTEQFDYGSYRILGFQTNEQFATRPFLSSAVFPPGTQDIGGMNVTYSSLSLYNGQDLFVQPDEIWGAQFNIYPASITTSNVGGGAMRAERPVTYQRRRARWFSGLRDYPVVTGTTNVQVVVQGFTRLPSPFLPTANPLTNYQYPVTCNVVAEMVTDTVYGDPVNPGPAARAGALVKVGARELGLNIDGREQIELVSAAFEPNRTLSEES